MITTSIAPLNITKERRKETTGQPSFFRKLRHFMRADARNLFERGYYSSFALRSGYPAGLDTTGLTITRNISYVSPPLPDESQQLDIIQPTRPQGERLPVFLFVHGGAWRSADKSGFLRVHENLCIRLARKGVVCINVNHRLAPKYQSPAAEKDVAAAIAWTYQNVRQYGGDPDQLFVAGHSSGGHLTALVATDPSYLAAHHLRASSTIRGIISISGVMDVEDFYHHSWFMRTQAVRPYFGNRKIEYQRASPINHLSATTPATLLLHAERHDEGLDQQAQRMERRLKREGIYVQRNAYPNADHFLILSKVNEPSYSLTDDIYTFMERVVAPPIV